ncbi:MAG: hypothetical protein LBC57_08755 [Treponema sp.]|jgi:hypothetical protein|nr:hypothetical protein [Treponema sp.]
MPQEVSRHGIFFRTALIVISVAMLSACSSQKEAEEAPIITSASYQHTLYNGKRQPIEAKAAKDDVPPFIITYFSSEEALLENKGGTTEVPGEVGDYFVRIERPAGNGYRQGQSIKVEYHIQKAFITISAEERQEFTYDGKPKAAAASAEPPVELNIDYYTAGNSNTAIPDGPPVNRGQYRALISFAGNEHYMGASKEIVLVIN